jgi:hypothetical protein
MIGTAGDTVLVSRGTAEIFLAEVEAAQWAITRWIDQRRDTSVTFGYLHGERAAGGP